MRFLPFALLALVGAGCGSTTSDVRPPTPEERREIVAVTKWGYEYESDPEPYRPSRIGVKLRFPHLRAKVVRILVSRSDPRFAATVVELRDRQGRRRPGTVVRLLMRVRGEKPSKRLVTWDPPWAVFESSGTGFSRACTVATPEPVRDLVCPNAWSVLRYQQPTVRLNTTTRIRVASADLHRVDWKRIILPGAACGATKPIRVDAPGPWGDALVRSAVFPWLPAIVVSTAWNGVRYGDLDGDGRDEAVIDVVCSNAGGTASGQYAFSSVIFASDGRWLRSVGIVTPQQPLHPRTTHTPVMWAEIRPGKVIAHEAWYGANDGTCCSSGRVRTIWTYSAGKLRAMRTIIERAPST